MHRVFLDVGAADGSSVRFFRDNCTTAHEFDIYCFEPLPSNVEVLRTIPGIVIIPAAAWSSDGKDVLYLGKYKSGTMFSDKVTGLVDPDNFVEIVTIDFARWVREHLEETDEIWLKLNVEGAEYEIIEHLYNNELIDWFDRIYLRWHAYKIPSLQGVHEKVKAMVPNAIDVWRKREIIPL